MPQIVCAQSAFRFHRAPPQLRALYPPLPGTYQDSNHRKLASCSTASDLLGTPIHRLVRARSAVNSGATYQSHLVGGELPFSCIQETDHGFLLAGPELTLLTMAPSIDRIELLMATYELCGSFSVFNRQYKPRACSRRLPIRALSPKTPDGNGSSIRRMPRHRSGNETR